MAFETHTSSLASPTSTGNQSYTGVGFQPKALIFFSVNSTAAGAKTEAIMGTGFAVSSTQRKSGCSSSKDAVTTTDNNRRSDDTAVIVTDGNNNIQLNADLVTMNADGFTLNWTTVQGTARDVMYIALGGADLTNAYVGHFTSPSTVGNKAVTGVGFQPDCVLNFMHEIVSHPSFSSGWYTGVGWAVSTSQRAAVVGDCDDNNSGTSDTQRQLDTAHCARVNYASTVFKSADHVSMDADGFTWNWDQVTGSARYVYVLCLKGGNYKSVKAQQKTSTGNKATTGVGFLPAGGFFQSSCHTTESITDHFLQSAGVASSSSKRQALWVGDKDNVATSETDSAYANDKVLVMKSYGSPTLDADADLASYDSDGFTLNWTTADATARDFVALLFGPGTAPAAGDDATPRLMHHYRQRRAS